MRNATELEQDTKAGPVPRGKGATCVKARGKEPLPQCHKTALTGDRERSEQLRYERFGCADRPKRLESICKNSATLSSMLRCPANRLEQWLRITQGSSEKVGGFEKKD